VERVVPLPSVKQIHTVPTIERDNDIVMDYSHAIFYTDIPAHLSDLLPTIKEPKVLESVNVVEPSVYELTNASLRHSGKDRTPRAQPSTDIDAKY